MAFKSLSNKSKKLILKYKQLVIQIGIIKQILMLLFSFLAFGASHALILEEDSIRLKGQLAMFAGYSSANVQHVSGAGRYLPQLEYFYMLPKGQSLDVELSVNMFGAFNHQISDSLLWDSKVKLYRTWLRYTAKQFELRAGLQKINFGSASILRPLMWFDHLDPRDPLQLTDGVYGMLGRYYFLNNTNLWLWILYGNQEPRTWDLGKTMKTTPEFGGRYQQSLMNGEAGLTVHQRYAESSTSQTPGLVFSRVSERRIAIDGKWDVGAGIWFEGLWINRNKDLSALTNQHLLTLGTDYTFPLGNGITALLEHMYTGSARNPIGADMKQQITAGMLSYPLSIFDALSYIGYYSWEKKNLYSFISYKHQFLLCAFHIMAYWNPVNYEIPFQQDIKANLGGKGIQFMLVYNH